MKLKSYISIAFMLILSFQVFAQIPDLLPPPPPKEKSKKVKEAKKAMAQKSTSSATAGDPENKRKRQKGDKLYQVRGYKISADIYESLELEREEYDEDVMRKLANAYRLNGDTYNAELWYARYITVDSKEEEILHYAQSLQSNEKCLEANDWFEIFDTVKTESSDNRGKELAVPCDEIPRVFKNDKQIIAYKLKDINSDALDFSPMYYKKGIVFSTSRKSYRLQVNKDAWTNQEFTDIYYAERIDQNTFSEPVPLRGVVNSRFHDATPSFTKTEEMMFFSRSQNVQTKSERNKKKLKVCATRYIDDEWDEVAILPFNDDAFNSCHPAISANGSLIIFSSDRPGGLGGMDLYVSENKGGTWSEPQNLGDQINTAGNEIFPSFVNGSLYFASNGHQGLGGLDIYSAQKLENDQTRWGIINNLGEPYNSTHDDFGFVMNEAETEGFFTSNRDYKTQDDIFGWERAPKTMEDVLGTIYAVDRKTGEKIDGAYITIKDLQGSILQKGRSGNLNYPVVEGETYTIEARKVGYEMQVNNVPATSILENDGVWYVEMGSKECVTVRGMVRRESDNLPAGFANVKLYNTYTGAYTDVQTDSRGYYSTCLDCNFEYDITAMKRGYVNGRASFNTFSDDCSTPVEQDLSLAELVLNDSMRLVNNMLYLDKNGHASYLGNTNPNITYVVAPNMVSLQDLTAGIYKPAEGQSVSLVPLYYDFNDADIRKDAAMELDLVVKLMYQYPSMEILISSHTDSRGESRYNQKLSQKRADSAAQYLLSKGIPAYRVLPSGFGESRPLNNCSDGVTCTEAEHQRNRRTEIKITKLDHNVRVDYQDKLPQVIDVKNK